MEEVQQLAFKFKTGSGRAFRIDQLYQKQLKYGEKLTPQISLGKVEFLDLKTQKTVDTQLTVAKQNCAKKVTRYQPSTLLLSSFLRILAGTRPSLSAVALQTYLQFLSCFLLDTSNTTSPFFTERWSLSFDLKSSSTTKRSL